MNHKYQSSTIVNARWDWLLPDGPWLALFFARIAVQARDEKLDVNAIAGLVHSELQVMVAYALARYGRSRIDMVEDVTQAVMVRLAEKNLLAQWNPQKGTPRAWLFGIARHVMQETIRKLSRPESTALVMESVECGADGPDTVAEHKDLVETARQWISCLAPKRRDAVVCHYTDTPTDDGGEKRSMARDYVNRSRGMTQLRNRARAAGLVA